MTRYTSEQGYGLDLSGPEPVWREKRQGWSGAQSYTGWRQFLCGQQTKITIRIGETPHKIPRYRIDEYIKKGLIDPARRDDL